MARASLGHAIDAAISWRFPRRASKAARLNSHGPRFACPCYRHLHMLSITAPRVKAARLSPHGPRFAWSCYRSCHILALSAPRVKAARLSSHDPRFACPCYRHLHLLSVTAPRDYCSANQYLNSSCKLLRRVRRGGYQPPVERRARHRRENQCIQHDSCGRLIAAPTADGPILLLSIHVSIGASIIFTPARSGPFASDKF